MIHSLKPNFDQHCIHGNMFLECPECQARVRVAYQDLAPFYPGVAAWLRLKIARAGVGLSTVKGLWESDESP